VSHYTQCKLAVKDQEAFIDALIANWESARGLKLDRSMIEIHEQPANLYGYQGDKREQTANLIIRRNHVGGASNDIGYMIKDGECTELISEFDRGSGYGLEWSKKVKKTYAVNVVKKAAVKKGYKLADMEEEIVDGKLQLTMRKRYEQG
jgi:Protein of unknown function (DUF1257)